MGFTHVRTAPARSAPGGRENPLRSNVRRSPVKLPAPSPGNASAYGRPSLTAASISSAAKWSLRRTVTWWMPFHREQRTANILLHDEAPPLRSLYEFNCADPADQMGSTISPAKRPE